MPLEGTRFGMTHATARSEARELKIGLCRERKGSSYRKYGTSVISHQALARSTAGPSASVHCRRNSPWLKPDCHTALPVAVTPPSPCPPHCPPHARKRLPWHQVQLAEDTEGEGKPGASVILDGNIHHQEWGVFFFVSRACDHCRLLGYP